MSSCCRPWQEVISDNISLKIIETVTQTMNTVVIYHCYGLNNPKGEITSVIGPVEYIIGGKYSVCSGLQVVSRTILSSMCGVWIKLAVTSPGLEPLDSHKDSMTRSTRSCLCRQSLHHTNTETQNPKASNCTLITVMQLMQSQHSFTNISILSPDIIWFVEQDQEPKNSREDEYGYDRKYRSNG